MDLKHPTTKIPHQENETPPHSQSFNLIPFQNGKSHHPPPPHTAATYRECLKNHAAGIGGHALDGCGEFMPSPAYTPTQPSSFKCAACGCHRNFHRRELSTDYVNTITPIATVATVAPVATVATVATRANVIDFHRPHQRSTSTSPSPPSPHLLLSLSTAADQNQTVATPGTPVAVKINERKRFRTKFSNDQKQKMLNFAEKVGWKMQRCDDKTIADFCNEIGIRRGVFKVWMHNNKNTLAKRGNFATGIITTATGVATASTTAAPVVRSNESIHQEHGSSSSS